jgi:hypothetical protein
MVAAFPLLLLVGALVAAEPSGDTSPEPAAKETGAEPEVEGVSPVELIPRVELRHEFMQAPHGLSLNATTTQIDIVFLRRVLFRWELPHSTLRMGDVPVSGYGDTRLQALGVLTSGPHQVSVLIAGVVANTASRPPLGAGKQQVFFGGAFALKPRPWWLPYLIAQEQLSFAGDEAREDVNQLVVRAGNIVFGPGRAWYKLDFDGAFDFQGNEQRLFGTVEVGSLLIGRVGLFVRSATQLAGQRQLDFTLAAGARYLFRLEKPR